MRLSKAKRYKVTVNATKNFVPALRAVIRGGLAFLKDHENVARVRWELIVTIREKTLDNS